ncbi:ABC transporter ATP-binding protein [Aquihabitans sp. McL0605]|uniref:ABC transporter ATP-binding protein n=1 Tax=Aquihabitans sp. McL0605 TaxID=3415671 RepID=UPI003CFA412C
MASENPPADTRLLAAYLRPERKPLGALLAVLVVAMVLPLAGPLLIGWFVDAALRGESAGYLAGLGALFLVTALAGDALQLVVTWYSVRLAWRVGNRLRVDLCRHALGLDLDWHGDHSAGQLIERIDGDIDAVTRFSSTAVLQLAGNAILVAGVLVISAFIDWRASVLIAVTVAVAVFVLARMRRIAVPFYDEEREVQSQLYGDLEERLGGLEDIRANGAGPWAVHKLHEHSAGWWHTSRRAASRGDGALSMAGAVFALGSILVLSLAVWQCRAGALSVGAVLALLRYSQMVSDPLWRVAEQLAEAQKAVAGTRRAARLLAEESKLPQGTIDSLPEGALSVAFDHVSFGYGTGTDVLHDVAFDLPAGSSLGIVGRTGSGKTTIGRLVARLWDTESGAVRVGGVDVRDLQLGALRSRIGVVTQEVEIFRAPLRDNLTVFGTLPGTDEQLVAALHTVGLGDWLASLDDGLDQHLEGGTELSAGEGQLLAFARLLLADPSIVLLDEASSRLDPATEGRLIAATDRLLAGRTAIIIAHRISTLDRVDQIVVLEHGNVVEQGRRSVLAADPTTRFHALLTSGRTNQVVGS